MIRKTSLFFCLYFSIGYSIAQNYHYRVSADFTIKESDGNIYNLTAGKVYYDLNNDILVYNMYFPEKVDWVVHDTSFYTFRNDLLESRYTIPKINEENILHLSLSSTLNDYGLSNTQLYKLDKVIQENDLIISTYQPKIKKLDKMLGKIIISLKEGNFNGVVFFSPEGKILKKLIVQDFIKLKGVFLPKKILEITYINNNESYKVTSFSNFKLNEKGNNEKYYNYNLRTHYK